MSYIANLISIEKVKEWVNGRYCIDAQTGKGKTTFCFDTLSTIAHERNKRILMFVNRSALNNQLNKEKTKAKYNNIDIYTYQKYEDGEYIEKPLEELDLTLYEFIIFDEIHSIFSDSCFDRYRENFYTKYLSIELDCKSVFLSATIDIVYNFFNTIPYENIYYIPRDYNYLENICSYSYSESIYSIIDSLKQNEKALIFISDIERGKQIVDKYPNNTELIYSTYSKTKKVKPNKYMKESLLKLINIKKSDKQLLVATKVIDNGVSIEDDKVKSIIIEVSNSIDFIQFLGRLRISNKNQKVNLYFLVPNKKSVYGYIKKYNDELNLLKELNEYLKIQENTRYSFLEENSKSERISKSKILYNDANENKLYNEYCKYMLEELTNIRNTSFEKIIAYKLYKKTNEIMNYEEEIDKKLLQNYIIQYMNVKITPKDIESFKIFVLNLKTYKDKSTSSSAINILFEKFNIPYKIISQRENERNENHGKAIWIISDNKKEEEYFFPDYREYYDFDIDAPPIVEDGDDCVLTPTSIKDIYTL